MKLIQLYNKTTILNITRTRTNETKIGESVFCIANTNQWQQELQASVCKFVLIGIPEDIGVRANFGRGGAHTAWKPALESFVNQQSNSFFSGEDCCILGHIEVDDLMEKAKDLEPKNKKDLHILRTLVSEIDLRVYEIIKLIIGLGKIPIVVGGGHNNAYPLIKATANTLGSKINVINCDPHTDFRSDGGRHSGNGFSYAYTENLINRYSVFCIHEQYNNAKVVSDFYTKNEHLYFSSYEDIFIRETTSFSKALNQTISFVKQLPCGVEIDLDAITNVPTSAKTSSGISPVQARQFAYQAGKNLQATYFHIAEGAPILSHIKADNKTGKLIAYLITDFIKGVQESVT